jgi:aminopeptidase N
VRDDFKDGIYRLHFKQFTPPTPGQNLKDAQVLPIAVGLLDASGKEVQKTVILEMTDAEQSFSFEGLSGKPVPSILRGFSAPVVLERKTNNTERAFLLANDTDPFNKWEAGRDLTKNCILAMINDGVELPADYLDALKKVARDDSLDPAFRAMTLIHPGNDELAQDLFEAGITPDPQKIHGALENWSTGVANHMGDDLLRLHADNAATGAYSPDAESVGKRKFQAILQGFISRLDNGDLARKNYAQATNMTEQLSALNCLLNIEQGQPELDAFYQQWSHDRLVMDMWFSAQALHATPQKAAQIVATLTKHTDFDYKNPNRFRAVIGGLSMNAAGFHDPTGASYKLLADWLIKLDPLNPQTTARMSSAFQSYKRYDASRQSLMHTQMQRITASPNLSGDTSEMLNRMLKT